MKNIMKNYLIKYLTIFLISLNFTENKSTNCTIPDYDFTALIMSLQSFIIKETQVIGKSADFIALKKLFQEKYGIVGFNLLIGGNSYFTFKSKTAINIEERVKLILKLMDGEEKDLAKRLFDSINKVIYSILNSDEFKKINEYSLNKENKEYKLIVQIFGDWEDNSSDIF